MAIWQIGKGKSDSDIVMQRGSGYLLKRELQRNILKFRGHAGSRGGSVSPGFWGEGETVFPRTKVPLFQRRKSNVPLAFASSPLFSSVLFCCWFFCLPFVSPVKLCLRECVCLNRSERQRETDRMSAIQTACLNSAEDEDEGRSGVRASVGLPLPGARCSTRAQNLFPSVRNENRLASAVRQP